MRQEAVHQGTTGISRSGMHYQSRGFVDHQEVRVFMNHIELHGFGCGAHSGIGTHGHDHGFTAENPVAWPPCGAVDEHSTGEQPGLEAAA